MKSLQYVHIEHQASQIAFKNDRKQLKKQFDGPQQAPECLRSEIVFEMLIKNLEREIWNVLEEQMSREIYFLDSLIEKSF